MTPYPSHLACRRPVSTLPRHWRDAWVFTLHIAHFSLGLGPHGEDLLGEYASVLATHPNGDRYLHFHAFVLHVPVRDAAGLVRAIPDRRERDSAEQFRAAVEKIASRGEWPGPRANPHWRYLDACEITDPAAPMPHEVDDYDFPVSAHFAAHASE